jgi:DNA-binding NarL/FixJ family response regulator
MSNLRRTVCVLSAHATLRQGIAALVRPSGVLVIESEDYLLRTRRIDVAIVDLDHAPGDALDLIARLRVQLEGAFLVVLGSAVRLAASSDDSIDAQLETARTDASMLLGVLSRRAPRPSSELSRARRQWAEVTVRQREVLRHLAVGLDNQTIAVRLRVTERAIKAHVSTLLARFGSANRTQLALLASGAGLRPAR